MRASLRFWMQVQTEASLLPDGLHDMRRKALVQWMSSRQL
jgi:hypothetical protein